MRIMGHKRVVAAAATALLAAAAVAGCSSSSSSTTAAGSSSTATAAESGTWASSAGTIVFAAVPDTAGSDSNWKPLEDYIAKETGYKVQFYSTSDYTALIAAAVAGKVDLAAFSGLTYVQAQNKGAKQEVISAVLSEPNTTDPGYYSMADVPAKSTITSVAQFKGKKLCFVDPNSTSGFLYPLLTLKAAGISVASSGTDASGDPQFADFTAFFAGAHDTSVQDIASGQCQAGFAEDSVSVPAQTAGKIKILGKTYVPGQPLTVSTTLPASVQAKLKSLLADVTVAKIQAAGITLTSGFKTSFYGVVPETDVYYDTIRSICKEVTAANCAPTS
jgi:phosphonate transport system substrate-binding protein